jgi:hypothetical protein
MEVFRKTRFGGVKAQRGCKLTRPVDARLPNTMIRHAPKYDNLIQSFMVVIKHQDGSPNREFD